ncbi:MAG: histidine kinase dimerization/phospho-acceptor domain-containing protein [Microcoleaceae cyanobacterium]
MINQLKRILGSQGQRVLMQHPSIICVDDEIFLLNSLRDSLRRNFGQEYSIEIAETAEEALQIFEELQSAGIEIPLIISDQIMPGMKGVEFLIQVYLRSPQTLQIMLTGQASVEEVGQAINDANLYRYISKPWQEATLVSAVQDALKNYSQAKKITEQNQVLYYLNTDLEQQVIDQALELKTVKQSADLANQTKSNFLTFISHELRTPLNSILGFSQILLAESILTGEQRKNLAQIRQSGEQLLTLINDLLAVSQLSAKYIAAEEHQCFLPPLFQFVQDILEPEASLRGIALTFQLDPELPECIQVDDRQLRYVLLQLVGNMIQLTHQGAVTVNVRQQQNLSCSQQPLPENYNQGFLIEFLIESVGVRNLPASIRNLLSTVDLSQAKYATDGKAAGLMISYDLVHLMGGNLQMSCAANTPNPEAFSLSFTLPVQNCFDFSAHGVGSETQPQPPTSLTETRYSTQPTVVELNRESLAIMPASWLQELHRGAAQCSDRLLRELVEQIPPEYTETATLLMALVENFRFDIILSLTEPS